MPPSSNREQFKAALAHVEAGMSIRRAAMTTGVSRQALSRRLDGHVAVDARRGGKPVLTSDEAHSFVDSVIHLANTGAGLGKRDLIDKVMQINPHNRDVPWDEDGPGREWFKFYSIVGNTPLRCARPASMTPIDVLQTTLSS